MDCGQPLGGEHDCPAGMKAAPDVPLWQVCSGDGCDTCPDADTCTEKQTAEEGSDGI